MRIEAFSKSYEDRKVVDFPGIDIEAGKIYGVIGSNGSGKSTLAKIVAGIITPDKKGKVFSDGFVGYLPQKSFPFRMSTLSNIMLNGKDRKKAERLMEELAISHLASKRADKLSGGETSRMALARLMMRDYELVILDEPTAAMDMETSIQFEEHIKEYVKETGCALILITHSLMQARRLADELWFLSEGRLEENGPAKKLLSEPETEKLRKYLEFYAL